MAIQNDSKLGSLISLHSVSSKTELPFEVSPFQILEDIGGWQDSNSCANEDEVKDSDGHTDAARDNRSHSQNKYCSGGNNNSPGSIDNVSHTDKANMNSTEEGTSDNDRNNENRDDNRNTKDNKTPNDEEEEEGDEEKDGKEEGGGKEGIEEVKENKDRMEMVALKEATKAIKTLGTELELYRNHMKEATKAIQILGRELKLYTKHSNQFTNEKGQQGNESPISLIPKTIVFGEVPKKYDKHEDTNGSSESNEVVTKCPRNLPKLLPVPQILKRPMSSPDASIEKRCEYNHHKPKKSKNQQYPW